MKIAVLGAGAWGTAFACVAAARHDVVLYARDSAQANEMSQAKRNQRYLPDVTLAQNLVLRADLATAVSHATNGLIVLATPTSAVRDISSALASLGSTAPLLWLSKGFEQDTGLLTHQIIAQTMGDEFARERSGPLSGPSFALEVARGLPTALTVAGSAALCDQATNAFHAGALRIYSTEDVIGVEVGGGVKNVLAIATGIVDALALGLNARAALITRGLAEMTRLGVALGARADTFMGLTGLGDLILTATGDLSRNRQVGLMLGRGLSVDAALAQLGHVAEGVRSASAVAARARKLEVEMPITDAVCAVLDGRLSVLAALERLLAREPKREGFAS